MISHTLKGDWNFCLRFISFAHRVDQEIKPECFRAKSLPHALHKEDLAGEFPGSQSYLSYFVYIKKWMEEGRQIIFSMVYIERIVMNR